MDAVSSALLVLIKRYIERQLLVYDAVKQLRPYFFIMDTASALELIKAVKPFVGTPSMGYWGKNNEWRYLIHGNGCRLTHTVTEEPIDWDAPDPQAFDSWFFSIHLKWLFNQTTEDETVFRVKSAFEAQSKELDEFVIAHINQLLQQDQLILIGTDNYKFAVSS